MNIELIHGDCVQKLKELPDNSVDSIVTDPPYGLSFMGKHWDYDVPSEEVWRECLRVLKPGGHLLSFAGTRTQHRMAVRIEDAGFEIRDMIAWVYGSGFPKSLNIGKSVNQLETNEWSKISKAIDNIDQKSIMDVWKTNAKPAGIQLSKSLTEVGSNTPKKFFVPDIAVLYSNQKNELLNATIAEMRLKGLSLILEEDGIIAVESAGQTIELLPENARLAVKLSESQNLKCWNIFTAQCDVKEWLNENTEVNHKVDEALKILRGNKKYSNEEITNVLCAVLPSVLKLTILNQSKTFQNLDTTQKTECVSAINVIITEYTAENLISNTVDILKSKAVDKLQGNEREEYIHKYASRRVGEINSNASHEYGFDTTKKTDTKGTSPHEGWGTALKPALEPITVARKPLIGTVAENVLTHGTGGMNIDGCRVESSEADKEMLDAKSSKNPTGVKSAFGGGIASPAHNLGRFPANLIHDGSEEVVGLFPQTKSGGGNKGNVKDGTGMFGNGKAFETPTVEPDSGSAARFFYCAKSSKRDRNSGLGGILTVKYNRSIIPNKEICKEENTVVVQLLQKVISEQAPVSFNIGECGESITAQCHQDSLSITKTTISKIIESRILNSLMLSLTNEYTEGANSETASGGNPAGSVESLRKWILDTTNGKTELALGASRVALQMLLEINKGAEWKERGNFHSTVKPTDLMRYLCRLVTPKGGTVLDPFMGSGSTGKAAKIEGFNFIGIEREAEYIEIARSRIEQVENRLF